MGGDSIHVAWLSLSGPSVFYNLPNHYNPIKEAMGYLLIVTSVGACESRCMLVLIPRTGTFNGKSRYRTKETLCGKGSEIALL